jgi:GNAT superfamily N-acetyltransferase
MDPYTLREATPKDLPIVLRHRRRMFEDMGRDEPGALAAMEEAARPLLGRWLAEGRYRGWLAEAAGEGVVAGGGIILLDFLPNARSAQTRRAWVMNVYTEPAHRLRGLARRLMDAMIAWSREQGLPALFLHASETGRPLYEGLGFEPTSEMRLFL